jgi:NADH:ubiquinone oxidoreductase subunit F (NADH-binding)
MTATLQTRPAPTASWSIGAPRLLAGLGQYPVLDAAAHRQVHGPLPAVDADRLQRLLAATPVFGRGGAGFPFLRKVQALRGFGRRVIVNGAESEPASSKDRTLLTQTPHLVLDGALAAARAIGANSVTIAVHDPAAAAAVSRAMRERRDASHVFVHRLAGGFVAGEARAVIRNIDGGPALPPGRPRHATQDGNLLSNTETFAQVAVLLRLGPAGYAATGTRAEPGTTLLTVGGAVERPGVVEIPLGTPLGILLRAAGGWDAQHVVVGGYHGRWLTPAADLPLSRAGLATAGGTLGAGVVLAVSSSTCALAELGRVTGWLAAQSAQQCGPCRFGLPALAADIAALAAGHPAAWELAHRHAALVEGRGACSHPSAAVQFVRSALRLLGPEVAAHRHGGCGRPVLGELPVGRLR